MQDAIFTTTPEFSELIGHGKTCYLQEQKLAVEAGFNDCESTLKIRDITHAMRPGELCQGVHVKFANKQHADGTGFQALQDFVRPYGQDLRRCLADLLARPWQAGKWGFEQIFDGDMTFTRSDQKAVRTYSPFGKLSPLPSIPAKWTVSHALRALWNGQFENLRCTGHYTDDYAFDASNDFGRGPIANARSFCKDIIESPSGWRAYGNGQDVSVCCHTFDSNSFRPKLT